jgi:hypothetical protein
VDEFDHVDMAMRVATDKGTVDLKVDRSPFSSSPQILLSEVLNDIGGSSGSSDPCSIVAGDGLGVNIEMYAPCRWHQRDNGMWLWILGDKVAGKLIDVHIELCIKGEVRIVSVVILMTFHVVEGGFNWKSAKLSNNILY